MLRCIHFKAFENRGKYLLIYASTAINNFEVPGFLIAGEAKITPLRLRFEIQKLSRN